MFLALFLLVHKGNPTDDLHIAHQTRGRIMWVVGVTEVIFCIASPYTLECSYCWSNAHGPVGVDSPVLYVKLPGVYKCTVKYTGHQVTSDEIVVEGIIQQKWCQFHDLIFPP